MTHRHALIAVLLMTAGLALRPGDTIAQLSPYKIQRPVSTLDGQPRFPGCDMSKATEREKLRCAEDKLEKYIRENLRYPSIARKASFTPRVVWVEITVEPTGRIHSPKVVQPGLQEYDENAQEVFLKMMRTDLRWDPGMALGKEVRSKVKIAVHYNWEGWNKAFQLPRDSVYRMVDQTPSLTGCQQKEKKDEEIVECVDKVLNDFFVQNLRYPQYAADAGMEDEVKVEFVVGTDSMVRHVRVVNDVNLSHDPEVLRVVNLMNEKKIGWIPGKENGKKVNVLMQAKVPFRLANRTRSKTKLKLLDPRPLFITGKAGFEDFLNTYLQRPIGQDVGACDYGVIQLKFRISRLLGETSITEVIDYNKLGEKFQEAAARFLEHTNGLWNTDYPNLDESTEYYVLVTFSPTGVACENVPPGYKDMLYKALEAAQMADNQATFSQSLEVLDQVVRLYPSDNKARHLRGMALYKNGHLVEGCVDLKFANKQNSAIEVPKSCRN